MTESMWSFLLKSVLRNACRSIVTRNTEDFSRIPKIEVIPY